MKENNLLKEMFDFIFSGNLLDLAIGIIIGGAFNNVITAFVESILMPLLGILIGGIDLTALSLTVGGAVLTYGLFLQALLILILNGIALFFLLKMMTNITSLKKEKEEEIAEPSVSNEEKILSEILTELKKVQGE